METAFNLTRIIAGCRTNDISNIPVGEPVQLVSIGVKNKKIVASVEKLVVSKQTAENITFKEVSASDMKENLRLASR